jgi:hypothetical protein
LIGVSQIIEVLLGRGLASHDEPCVLVSTVQRQANGWIQLSYRFTLQPTKTGRGM